MDDQHIVEFSETGYGLQHPLSCRPNLLDCEYEIYLREFKHEPDKEPGRYVMMIHEGHEFDGFYMVTYTDFVA